MKTSIDLVRCEWCTQDDIYKQYHDLEWGMPLHDDQKLFELLSLEGAQAGLSWLTVLKKRTGYRKAFNNFKINQVSKFSESKINELINNPKIIRNKLKVNSVVKNARSVLQIQKEFGSFDNYLWQYVSSKPIDNKGVKNPKADEIAKQLSKDLKKRGMNFIGPTICYAFMQSCGMINDHTLNCFRYEQLLLKK
jgi:DNA-3-methyladenine glycosylase I